MCGDKEDVLAETRAWCRGPTHKSIAANGTYKENFLGKFRRVHWSTVAGRHEVGGVHNDTLVDERALSAAGPLAARFWWLTAFRCNRCMPMRQGLPSGLKVEAALSRVVSVRPTCGTGRVGVVDGRDFVRVQRGGEWYGFGGGWKVLRSGVGRAGCTYVSGGVA